MRKDENVKNLYFADEGKIFVSKADKEVKAKSILLATWDNINNYDEVDESLFEEIKDDNSL